MVNFKTVASAFIVLTVIFIAATGYLLANPVTVSHTVTTTQLATSTLTTTSIPPAVTSTSVGTVTATQVQTAFRTQNFTATTTTTSTAMVTSGFSVNIAYKPGIGFYLTNGSGMTLYFRTTDVHSTGTSTCTGGCVGVWPTFYTANLVLPPGLNASAFTVVTRTDGKQQIDYNGWPLYTYFGDKAPGDTSGQGIGGIWFAYSLPVPSQLTTSTTTSTTTASSTTSSTTTSTTTTTTGSTYTY